VQILLPTQPIQAGVQSDHTPIHGSFGDQMAGKQARETLSFLLCSKPNIVLKNWNFFDPQTLKVDSSQTFNLKINKIREK
jgi:hypothetical protein